MTLFNHFHNKELLYKTVVKERYFAVKFELEELKFNALIGGFTY